MRETAYGYSVSIGYFGRVGSKWILFATEQEYYDYISEE